MTDSQKKENKGDKAKQELTNDKVVNITNATTIRGGVPPNIHRILQDVKYNVTGD
jgi:hypothetical protein